MQQCRSAPGELDLMSSHGWELRKALKAQTLNAQRETAASVWGALHSWNESKLPIDVWAKEASGVQGKGPTQGGAAQALPPVQ